MLNYIIISQNSDKKKLWVIRQRILNSDGKLGIKYQYSEKTFFFSR